LAPFAAATKILSGRKYSTLTKAIFIKDLLLKYLKSSRNTRTDIIKRWLLEEFSKYLGSNLSAFEKEAHMVYFISKNILKNNWNKVNLN
jgi:hypothetical protein